MEGGGVQGEIVQNSLFSLLFSRDSDLTSSNVRKKESKLVCPHYILASLKRAKLMKVIQESHP